MREGDKNVDDYFRLFLAPGTEHCIPGSGPFPTHVLQDLMAWVEEGRVPELLVAQDVSALEPATGELKESLNGTEARGRLLCMVSKVQQYIGGGPDMLSSFRCVEL